MQIPKIIHQVWLGKQNERPEDWMQTFRDIYPDWEYKLWTEDNLPTLVNQAIYESEERNHTKANLIRYEMVCKFGGVHFDADMTALKPIPDEFLEQEFFSAYESERYVPGLIPSAVFGAVPNHPILKTLIDTMKDQDQSRPSWKFNGTQFFTDTIEAYQGKKKIYPSHTFHPQHFRDKKAECDPERLEKAYTFHHWGTSKNIWITRRK